MFNICIIRQAKNINCNTTDERVRPASDLQSIYIACPHCLHVEFYMVPQCVQNVLHVACIRSRKSTSF